MGVETEQFFVLYRVVDLSAAHTGEQYIKSYPAGAWPDINKVTDRLEDAQQYPTLGHVSEALVGLTAGVARQHRTHSFRIGRCTKEVVTKVKLTRHERDWRP